MGLVPHYFSSRDFLYKHTAWSNTYCNTGRLMANRVLIGDRGGGDYGLYVSNPSVNVLTATDDELMFNSDAVEGFNALQNGTVTCPDPGSSTGFNEGTSGWISYNGLGITYPPLILLSKGGTNSAAPLRAFDADYILSGEGIYEPSDIDVFLFTTLFYENDFTNRQFRVTHRNFKPNPLGFLTDITGPTTSVDYKYFLFAIGDTAANGGANYYTSGP